MPIVMRMPVIGLHGNGVLDFMKITHRAQDRLEQHAQRQDHQQGVVKKTAVAANVLHVCFKVYRLAA